MRSRARLLPITISLAVFAALSLKVLAQTPQSSQCLYKTKVAVYKDAQSGTPLSKQEVAPRTAWGVYNNKQGRLIKAGEFGDTAQLAYENQNEKLDGGYERYRQGEKASVTLSGFGIGTNWRIKDIFCDDSKSTAKSCPKDIQTQSRSQTIQGFTVACGTDITYGWILEKIASPTTVPTISPIPQKTLTPAPTAATPTNNSTAYLLSIWNPESPLDACYVALDTKTGYATSRAPHCTPYACRDTSGKPAGLVVDYQNQIANKQLEMSAQTNRCEFSVISGLSPTCLNKLQRLDQFHLPYRDTMRCVWKNVSSSGKIECRNLGSGTTILNEKDVCAAEMSGQISTTPQPTISPKPLTPTPKKSCSCDRINQPNLNENVCNSGCEVFHTVGNSCNYTSDCTKRVRITPTLTTTPKPLTSPTKTPTPPTNLNSFFNKENIILNWNFNAPEDKKKDTHIWALKVGICDSPSTAAYSRKNPKAGGNGARCKWYDTEVTREELTNAKPGGRIGKPDTRMRSTRPSTNIMLDYDDKPVQKDKVYYFSCQYYAGTTAPTREEIRNASPNADDEWRRCEPRAATTDEQLVFLNILDPNTSIGRVPPDVVLSEGGKVQAAPKEGQAYLGVGLNFDFDYFKHLPRITLHGIINARAIRVGLCPYEPITGGDFDKCMFAPPQPNSDIQVDIRGTRNLKSQKYFFFTTDSANKPISLTKKYFATCQYILNGVIDPSLSDVKLKPEFAQIRRCWPQEVAPHAYFSKNPKIDLPWKNVLDTEGSFPLQHPSYGSLPLFSMVSADEKSIDFTICDTQTQKCSSKTQDVFPQSRTVAAGSSLLTTIGGDQVLTGSKYTINCTTDSGDTCEPLTVGADDPIYLTRQNSKLVLTSASRRCDQNGDGACNSLDLVKCMTSPSQSCDVNLDGTINATDYSVSLKQVGKN